MPGKVLTLPMVQTASGCLRRNGPDFESEFGSGGERIATDRHRRGAGMRFLPEEGDGMTLDAFGSENNTERKAHALKNRTLLDVKFKISRGIVALPTALRESDRFRHRIARRASSIRTPSLSVRTRSASMVWVPAKAEEPRRLRPKRAPSSSAQSTRRTVTGGRPLIFVRQSAAKLQDPQVRRGSRRAIRHWALSQDDRQAGALSSDSPGRVTQPLPAAS